MSNILTEEEVEVIKEKKIIPVEALRNLAIKIKKILDERIDKDIEEHGSLTEFTRRWVNTYTEIINSLQKAISDKNSVNQIHLHKHNHVTHADIASKLREIQEDNGN